MTNLHDWSLKIQGAREMLQFISDQRDKGARIDLDPAKNGEGKVYTDAILKLALSSMENTDKYLCRYPIAYRNHERDKKGKLIKCEAFFLKP